MDEEIMDFQWFEHVYAGQHQRRCVARRMSKLPRSSSLRCSKPNVPFFEPPFTRTPPHWRQSQLGKRWYSAAGSSWDDLQSTPLKATCVNFLDARLFWTEDWSASLGHGTRRIVILFQCRLPRRTEQPRSKSSHVHAKLLHQQETGEKGRAVAAAKNAPPVPVTEQIVQKIKSLYPADPEPPAPAQAFVSGLFITEVAGHDPYYAPQRCLDSVNKDHFDMRSEHWYDLGVLVMCKKKHT